MIIRKPPEIPREVAKRFLRDMRDYHAELNPITVALEAAYGSEKGLRGVGFTQNYRWTNPED